MDNFQEMIVKTMLSGGDPSEVIDNVERKGQRDLVDNVYGLPKIANRYFKLSDDESLEDYTKASYMRMGIKILREEDELFLKVELPEGWRIEPDGNNYWSRLLDDQGRQRGSIFFKNSFYDRDAFINFNTRYTWQEMPFDDYESKATYLDRKANPWYGVVFDSKKEIFRSAGTMKEGYDDHQIEDTVKTWLNENYPEWQDIHAYWE